MSNRILDYPEATEITSNDYILLDNEGTGAKCIKASALNINMDNYTIKEARGAIASFEDGEDLPLAFMGAYIEPVQDLHGYDYPWVGGSGRNLFNMGSKVDGTIADVTYTSDDEYLYMNGTKQGGGYADLPVLQLTLSAGIYYVKAITISGTASNSVELYPYDGSTNLTSSIINTERTLTLEEEKTFRFRFAIWTDGTVLNNYKVGIVISKTANIDKFYPYSNICPISGWTACNVVRTGKNLVYNTISKATISSNGKFVIASSLNNDMQIAQVKKGIVYTITSDELFVGGFFTSEPINGSVTYNNSRWADTPKTFTAPIDGYVAFRTSNGYSTPQMEVGSTSSSYEPYNGHTYTIDLNGTRYGGYVDLVSGVLTVENASVDLGTLDWQYSSISERFYVDASDLGVKATDASTPFNAISSALIAKSYNEIEAKTVDHAIAINPNATQLFARYSSITSASDFITAMNGVQLVYELATPLTYQLSKQQIRSLVGVNNIFADTGDSVVDYRKLWVKPEM